VPRRLAASLASIPERRLSERAAPADIDAVELVLGFTMIALAALVLRWGFPKLPTRR
jgi:hypothetical protein